MEKQCVFSDFSHCTLLFIALPSPFKYIEQKRPEKQAAFVFIAQNDMKNHSKSLYPFFTADFLRCFFLVYCLF